MVQKRWQDWINLILGLWTFVSPWVFGFAAGTSIAALAMWILGAAIAVFAAFAVYMHKAWEEVINILLGIALGVEFHPRSRRRPRTLWSWDCS